MHIDELKYLVQKEIYKTAKQYGIDIYDDSSIIITYMINNINVPMKSAWGMAAIFNDDRFIFKFKYSVYTNNVKVAIYKKMEENDG